MSHEWLKRLADRVAVEPRFDIGRNDDVYLRRWTLWGRRAGPKIARAVFLHQFLRSDYDTALHDHPWPFVSVILSGGYWEHAANPDGTIRRRWFGPGRVLRRPAEYRHRAELPPGRDCWTLVFRGKKCRSWFFHCFAGGRLTGKVVPWMSFVDRIEAGALGCGDDQ
jgi:hypothetical protein